MCGRITQIEEAAAFLAELGPAQQVLNFIEPGPIARYNIAPSAKANILHNSAGGLKFEGVKWGWRPTWAQEKFPHAINAKAETVASGKFFKAIWTNRALVPASGWYEWLETTTAPKHKQPYYITRVDGRPLFFAGLCQVTEGLSQAENDGFAIITSAADARLQEVHHRKPVVFSPEHAREWIDPDTTSERAQALIRDHALMAESFDWYTVGKAVGKAENQGPGLIERVEPLQLVVAPITLDFFG